LQRARAEHPEDAERMIEGIRAETGRMGRLVEDLLLLAGLDEGRPLLMAPVDLRETALRCAATSETVGPEWPVHVADGGPVEVLGDSGRLEQVLDNLLANVRAHTPAGTRTTLEVSVLDDEAVVVVADRGPGMSQEAVERVFERFYREDPSRSRATGGAGLGLAIVAAIVGAHGGRVDASSSVGTGTVVTVRLPLLAEPVAEDRLPVPVSD
jgi:two-component system, OmpR family, sensor kinase